MDKDSKSCLVWDVPTRVFHWLMVASFITAYVTGSDDHMALVHAAAGYNILGLLFFRLLWGFIGSRYARFSNFIRGPREIYEHLRCLCQKKENHYTGHNPAGGVAILLILAFGLTVTISGALLYQETDWPMLEEIHGISTNIMLAVVVMHVLGVLLSSIIYRENLVLAMITGLKMHCGEPSIHKSYKLTGMLMMVTAFSFCLWFIIS